MAKITPKTPGKLNKPSQPKQTGVHTRIHGKHSNSRQKKITPRTHGTRSQKLKPSRKRTWLRTMWKINRTLRRHGTTNSPQRTRRTMRSHGRMRPGQNGKTRNGGIAGNEESKSGETSPGETIARGQMKGSGQSSPTSRMQDLSSLRKMFDPQTFVAFASKTLRLVGRLLCWRFQKLRPAKTSAPSLVYMGKSWRVIVCVRAPGEL